MSATWITLGYRSAQDQLYHEYFDALEYDTSGDNYTDYLEPEIRHSRMSTKKDKRVMSVRPKFEKKKFHRIFHKLKKVHQIGDDLTEEDEIDYQLTIDFESSDDISDCADCYDYKMLMIKEAKLDVTNKANKEITESEVRCDHEERSQKDDIDRQFQIKYTEMVDPINAQIEMLQNQIEILRANASAIGTSIDIEWAASLTTLRARMYAKHNQESQQISKKYDDELEDAIDDIEYEAETREVCVKHDSEAMHKLTTSRYNECESWNQAWNCDYDDFSDYSDDSYDDYSYFDFSRY
jgi:hypothetical protein